MFLRNRKIEMKLVNDKEEPKNIYLGYRVAPEKIAELANDFVRKTAVTVVAVYSVTTAVKSITKITEIVVKAKFK